MALLEPWVCDRCGGSAKSASTELDAETIMAGCDEVMGMVEELRKIADGISEKGTSITPYILRVDEYTVEQNVSDCLIGITDNINQIQTKADGAKIRAMAQYNKIQRQYDKDAIAEHKEKHRKEDEEAEAKKKKK